MPKSQRIQIRLCRSGLLNKALLQLYPPLATVASAKGTLSITQADFYLNGNWWSSSTPGGRSTGYVHIGTTSAFVDQLNVDRRNGFSV